jgi:hypothetical protein
VQRLLNGNTLICEGNRGNFFEVNQMNTIVWKYINPINNFGSNIQGSSPINTDVFKVVRYSKDFPGFDNKNMTGTSTLEINTTSYDCDKISTSEDESVQNISIYPNPTNDIIFIRGLIDDTYHYIIRDLTGKIVLENNLNNNSININSLPPSLYAIQINFQNKNKSFNFVFNKL